MMAIYGNWKSTVNGGFNEILNDIHFALINARFSNATLDDPEGKYTRIDVHPLRLYILQMLEQHLLSVVFGVTADVPIQWQT